MRFAFVGLMHAGKTTAAEYLVTHHGAQRMSFARPVKEATAAMLNTLIDYADKDIDVHQYCDLVWIEQHKNHPTIRQLLQMVGTELGRNWLGPETIWVDILENRIRAMPKDTMLVVDDCRFVNEADMLRDNGFVMVRVERPTERRIESITASILATDPTISGEDLDRQLRERLNHASELDAPRIRYDMLLQNMELEDTYAWLDAIVGQLNKAAPVVRFGIDPDDIARWEAEGGQGD